MTFSDYRIEPADYKADFADLRTVRDSVFVIELRIPADLEQDDSDPLSYHVIARDNFHAPIGTGRLSPDGRLGRIAVLNRWRNQGVGKALMRTLIERARQQGLAKITLETPPSASGFFQLSGFSEEGNVFQEAGIELQRMSLNLEPIAVQARPKPKPRAASIATVKLENLEAHRNAAHQLIRGARRQLCIYTRDLEHLLYGHDEIIEAFRQFAIDSRDGSAQIIVQDTAAARSKPHHLIDLSQRLPSSFQFRAPVELEDLQYPSALLLNDKGGYLFRLLADRYEGEWSPNHPVRNRQLQEEFDRIWQRSRPCIEFRALGI